LAWSDCYAAGFSQEDFRVGRSPRSLSVGNPTLPAPPGSMLKNATGLPRHAVTH